MPAASPGRTLTIVTGAAVAIVGVGVAITRRRALLAKGPPAEAQWRRVGSLAELQVFPLKSGQPVATKTLLCTESGPREGPLRDR